MNRAKSRYPPLINTVNLKLLTINTVKLLNYLVYFKVASRQTISAAVLPKVRTPLVLHYSQSLSTDEVLTRSDVPVLADDPVHEATPVGGVQRA